MPDTGPWRRDALLAGTVVGDYKLEAVIGSGGFGIVYRAQHVTLDLTVAIKEYMPAELALREGSAVRPRSGSDRGYFDDGMRRFREEARALIAFRSHSSIVSFRDFFLANGTAYLVMDYEDGVSLADLLAAREQEGRPFDQRSLLAVMEPLLEGLALVHEAGILHRDIKPSNILIRRSNGRPVLIDFGAAKQVVASRTKSMAPFTEGYAALEQVADVGDLGPWTDIYGVGAVMWRMVAGGRRPWEPPNPLRVERRSHAALARQQDPLPSARDLGEGRFAPSLLAVIDRCLRLRETERVQNCGALLKSLSNDAGNRSGESMPVATSRSTGSVDNRTAWKPRVGALAAALVLAVVLSQWWSAVPERDSVHLDNQVAETTLSSTGDGIEITTPSDRIRMSDPENPSQGAPLPDSAESTTDADQDGARGGTADSAESSASGRNEVAHRQQAELRQETGTETTSPEPADRSETSGSVEVGTGDRNQDDDSRPTNPDSSQTRDPEPVESAEQGGDARIDLSPNSDTESLDRNPSVPNSDVVISTTDNADSEGETPDPEDRPASGGNRREEASQANSDLSEPRTEATTQVDSRVQRERPTGAPSQSSRDQYWTVGSHANDVLRLQGTPTDINRYPSLGKEVWWFGTSSVEFDFRTKRVMQWSNAGRKLKVRMQPSGTQNQRSQDQHWTVGSHADDVLRLQGTPTDINRYPGLGKEVWWFGTSSVEFDFRTKRVMQWSNAGRKLKVRMRIGNE